LVQYKHTEHRQARRNERPLSAFVRGKRTLRTRESALTERKRQRERDREKETIAGWIT